MKRKWYGEDAFSRRESHTYGVVLPPDPAAYVRDTLGLSATRLTSPWVSAVSSGPR